MKMKADQERVRTLLCDTVKLLCKNGLAFDKELRVQGLLGITLDENEVFIVHINERLDNKSAMDEKLNNEGCDVNDLARNQINKSLLLSNYSVPQQQQKDRSVKRTQDVVTINHHDDIGPPPSKKPLVIVPQVTSPPSVRRGRKKKHTTHINNNNISDIKDELVDDEDLVLLHGNMINNNCIIKDDRNAMLDMYGADNHDELPDLPSPPVATPPTTRTRQRKNAAPRPSAADIPPPPLALYGEHASSHHQPSPHRSPASSDTIGANTAAGLNNHIPEFTDDDELKAPDPSMGGPFITGIVQHHVVPTVPSGGSDGSEDRSWDDLGQIGPLTHDGQVVLEGTQSWEEAATGDESDSNKLNTPQMAAENALMMYGLPHQFVPENGNIETSNTSPSAASAAAVAAAARRMKEGRRSWTSKNKPYMCKVEGCNKSYFFVHDLRRHERQKHPDRPPTNTDATKRGGPGGRSQADTLVLNEPIDFSNVSPISVHNGMTGGADSDENTIDNAL